jgi:hypothetical protein
LRCFGGLRIFVRRKMGLLRGKCQGKCWWNLAVRL